MKHLIIYTHLNPKSFSKAVADEVEKIAIQKGHEIRFIDLYSDKFNPVLELPDIEYSFMGGDAPDDVKMYQEHISWADHITFVYPIWWEQMPAILKGFIDRVFTNGYAFIYDEDGSTGLLVGKSVQLIINTGNPSEILEKNGLHAAVKKVNEVGIFEFCGMTAKTSFFGDITMGTDKDRKQYLNSIGDIIG